MSAPALARLVTEACRLRYDDIPREAVDRTKALIYDATGCIFGSQSSVAVGAARAMARELGGAPSATLIGTRERTSAALATFVNGTALRYLDYNDYYFGRRDPAHPSGAIPAAMALAETHGRSGRAMIEALVTGYEIHLRLCDAAGSPNLWKRGWHLSTSMQFSAAFIAARLMGLDEAGIANAIAISVSHHNTLAQLQSGKIAMMKATAEAWVAKGAVEAAFLARHGITGPDEIFEGKFGWEKSVAGEIDYDLLTAPFTGERILDTCEKPFPVVGSANSCVQAALELHAERRFDEPLIQTIRIGLPAFVLGTPSGDDEKRFPKNRETADHSYQYCTVVALVDGRCGEAQFTPEKIGSPLIRRLLEKIEVYEDAALTENWKNAAGACVSVVLKSGEVFEKRVAYQPGHRRNPLTDAQRQTKFEDLMPASVSREQRSRIVGAIASLDDCERVSDFMNLLAVDVGN